MEQYISKSALLEFISILTANLDDTGFDSGYLCAMDTISSMVNTLEVKSVDLEKEMDKEWNKCEPIDEGMGLEIASIEHEQFDNISKHFFELGLCSTITEEDMKLIWTIGDELPYMPEEDFFKELLKRFKLKKI